MATQSPSDRLDWRQYALIVVVVGAMIVSTGGQVSVLKPVLNTALAVVFALTNDAGAVLALEAGLSAAKGSSIRRWAWAAILLAAGTGAALNWWHASNPPDAAGRAAALPEPLTILVGVEPIVLILVLSHLVGLVLAERRSPAVTSADGQPARPATSPTASADTSDREIAPARPRDPAARSITGDREIGHQVGRETGRENDHGGREPAAGSAAGSTVGTASLVASTGAPPRGVSADREPRTAAQTARTAQRAQTVRSAGGAAVAGRAPGTTPLPRRAVAAVPDPAPVPAGVPDVGRPDWMTPALLRAVVASALRAGAPARQYGEGRLIEDNAMPDGARITSHKAKEILRFIRDHDLLRRLEASA